MKGSTTEPTNDTSIDIDHYSSCRRVSFSEEPPQYHPNGSDQPQHQQHQQQHNHNNSVPLLLQPSYARSKSMIYDELRNFRICLKWCALDHSSCVGRLISYVSFIFLALIVPLFTSLFVQVSASSPEDDPISLNKLVQIPESGLAIIAFFTLYRFFRRYGLRQLLFLDALQDDTTYVRRGYARELEKAFRYLAYIILPSFFVELAHKIIFFSAVRISAPRISPGFPLNSIVFVLVLVSWVYRTGVYLLVCVIFRLTCQLQILRFEGVHKLFEVCGSDSVVIFKEHVRIRRQLWVISHRYRFFIVGCVATMTVSQLGALLLVLASKCDKTFFNSGDLLICSAVQLSGFFLCVLGAAKITHRAQGIVSIATRWHMLVTSSSAESEQCKDQMSEGLVSDSDSDSSDIHISVIPQRLSSFHTRQSLGTARCLFHWYSIEVQNINTIVRQMSDESVFSTSETEENLVSAPPFAPITADVLLPLSVGRRNRSEAWNHFTTNPGSDKRARCNYCSCLIKYDNGTSSMRSHLMRCKNNPNKDGNKRQKSISSSIVKAEGLVGSSSLCDKFDQEACRNGLVKMIIGTDLPIPMVGRKVFREFLNSLQPRFRVPSCATLVHDILKLWDAERTKLKSVLSQHSGRVCLTIDKWTSCQDLSYMCLTSHFVDNNYILHKRILNFCPIESCSGEVMAKTIELCLNGWGLSRVLSLTADHVLPNDLGIQYLKKRLMSWNNLVLKGEYIHMHCCPHILNIIVKEGLSDIDDSILRISAAVKYIRSSPSILSKFEACVDDEEKIEYKGLVCLDVEAKWNLIYEMLEGALNHRKIFEDLELQDKEYVHELEKGKGVPTCEDWNNARLILPFLKIFYEAMLRISGTSYVTSNVYMLEVFGIGRRIRKMCNSKDVSIRRMAERLRKKYDEYWGNPDTLNMLLLIAVIFNPRCKVGYMNWIINQIFDLGEAANLKEKLESCLKLLFEEYIDGEEEPQNDSQEARFDEDGKENPYSWNQFLQSTRHKSSVRFELNKYLEEDIETSPDLDILNWWKLNSNRFPILANIAREVLAIPVSTIASEFAFSTGAKMLDSYCSFLTPELLEALVCTQDLLNGTPSSLVSYKDMEKLKLSDKDMERLKQANIFQQDLAW